MSDDKDVEVKEALNIEETSKADVLFNEEVLRNQETTINDCPVKSHTEEHVSNLKSADTQEDESNLKSEEPQDNIEGPPCVEDTSDINTSRWCDNYEFVSEEKSDIDFNEKDPQKLMLWAAEKNELETLRKLLESDSSLVNTRDNDLYTPLHRASYNNNVEVIRILLSYDADISAKTIDGWQPLHCACKWDSVEAVSLLIQNGADVNAQTNGHITPLHLAASNVYGRRTLELLLWHPYIDPNITNDAGDTAYDIACRSGPLGALFEILEESVNVY